MTTSADTTSSVLDRRLSDLVGVTASKAKAFAALEVSTLGDLLEYFPRDYRFESEELPIAQFVADQVHIARGEVVAANYTPMHPRPRFEATISDGSAKLALVWFNGGWLKKKIVPGMHLRVQGK